MLINLSNHPSDKWTEKQKEEALKKYNDIADIPFPAVHPDEDENYIKELAVNCFEKCISLLNKDSGGKENAVHVMGEFTLTFSLVNLLINHGIKCIASTTSRIIKELSNNKSEVSFEFVRFREYGKI